MRRPVNSPYSITTTFAYPTSTSKFGKHTGVDYSQNLNQPIYAPISGTIVAAYYSQYNGNMVVLFDGQFYHRLMHNNSIARGVGSWVNEGDVIAYAGTTGLSTGVHCHWDITRVLNPTDFSQFVSPAEWLAGKYPQVTFTQRRVGANGVNYRTAPNTGAGIITGFAPGEVLNFKGYVIGQSIDGNDKWFVGRYSNGYAWSRAFTDSSVSGLNKLN